ncbi:aminotransferase class V-fold PLP-dependent enzyme [Rathayibacter soli]|uniref:aminotransferase class V-fold PLP-dependent enzyme n=1 Tax=Rathayibacter soli TaxID=3144168 RepID=UPI0027E5927E|nr:aminotransferase class V-fold PLP-dependent enzyme [Glaciibacter superstes]
MTTIEAFALGFVEDPGYLDYGRVGPLSATVMAELQGGVDTLGKARFGSVALLHDEAERLHAAAASLLGFPADQIVTQPNTGTGLMHALFGISGPVLISAAEFPSITLAAARAAESLGRLEPVWMQSEHGRVTPGQVAEHLTDDTTAVVVSLVDSRTGYLTDIEGIRQVIGDRLLIVDAIQGLGVVDAPYSVADVVASGGQKWTRAGWGTGVLAMSERAIERIEPVFSGASGTDAFEPFDEIFPPTRGARAFTLANADRLAEAAFAAALEEISEVGVAAIQEAVSTQVDAVIELADEFSLAVASSRDPRERAGIVILAPEADELTRLRASLFNHGVTVTTRGSVVRLSVHAVTADETLDMLRGAFTEFARVG